MNLNEKKFKTVIEKNTFYFYNPLFQTKYEESHIIALKNLLFNVKTQVELEGLNKNIFDKLLMNKEYGLRALLALTGFANESLKRLITVARVSNNEDFAELLHKDGWADRTDLEVKEWGDAKISNLLKTN